MYQDYYTNYPTINHGLSTLSSLLCLDILEEEIRTNAASTC